MNTKDVSLIIPSHNNLVHLKNAYESVRKYYPEVELIIIDDASTDGTKEWLEGLDDCQLIWWGVDKRQGHTILYDKGIEASTKPVVGILHADMYIGPNYLENLLKHLERGVVVCATRVEPPLHPAGKEKIIKDFGQDFDSLDMDSFYKFALTEQEKSKNKTTRGMFAPWLLHVEDFWDIGGHDWDFAPFPYEDSITGERPILIDSEKGQIEFITIEDLFKRYEKYVFVRDDGKEIIDLNQSGVFIRTASPKKGGVLGREVINKIIRKKNNKDIYKVRFSWGETYCTEDHSLLDSDLNEIKPTDLKSFENTWYPEHIDYSRRVGNLEKDFLDITNGLLTNKVKTFNNIRRQGDNIDLIKACEFLGFFVAEGWVSGNYYAICQNDIEVLDRYKELSKSLIKEGFGFGDHYIISKKEECKDVYKYSKYDKELSSFLGDLCGRGSENKRVPNFIINLPLKYQKAFLYGFLVGDGYLGANVTRNNSYDAISVNKRLLFHSKIFPNLVCKLSSRSRLLIAELNYLIRRCFPGLKTNLFVNNRKKNPIYELQTVNSHKKVTPEVENLGRLDCYVYDLEVRNSHTFADAFGFVGLHNTDIFQRWILNGYKLIQSRDSLVYHLTCRGHRWTEEVGKDSDEFKMFEAQARDHYIRKWGSWIENDEWGHPVIIPVYKKKFTLTSPNDRLSERLEPWFNGGSDIEVTINPDTFTEADFRYITILNKIIKSEQKIGQFRIGNIYITVNSLDEYQDDLIYN